MYRQQLMVQFTGQHSTTLAMTGNVAADIKTLKSTVTSTTLNNAAYRQPTAAMGKCQTHATQTELQYQGDNIPFSSIHRFQQHSNPDSQIRCEYISTVAVCLVLSQSVPTSLVLIKLITGSVHDTAFCLSKTDDDLVWL